VRTLRLYDLQLIVKKTVLVRSMCTKAKAALMKEGSPASNQGFGTLARSGNHDGGTASFIFNLPRYDKVDELPSQMREYLLHMCGIDLSPDFPRLPIPHPHPL